MNEHDDEQPTPRFIYGGRWPETVGGHSVIERHHPAGSPLSRRCALAGVRALQAAAFRRQQERQDA